MTRASDQHEQDELCAKGQLPATEMTQNAQENRQAQERSNGLQYVFLHTSEGTKTATVPRHTGPYAWVRGESKVDLYHSTDDVCEQQKTLTWPSRPPSHRCKCGATTACVIAIA